MSKSKYTRYDKIYYKLYSTFNLKYLKASAIAFVLWLAIGFVQYYFRADENVFFWLKIVSFLDFLVAVVLLFVSYVFPSWVGDNTVAAVNIDGVNIEDRFEKK